MENDTSWPIFTLDLASLFTFFVLFYHVYSIRAVSKLLTPSDLILLMGVITIFWLVISLNSSLCTMNARTSLSSIMVMVTVAYSLLSAVLIVIVAAFHEFRPNNQLLLYPILFSFFTSALLRCLAVVVLNTLLSRGHFQKAVLVIGGDRVAERVVTTIQASYAKGYRLLGVVADYYHETMPAHLYLGKLNRFLDIVRSQSVNEVIIALPMRREHDILSVVRQCEFEGIRCKIVPDLYRVVQNQATLDYLVDIPMLSIRTEPLSLIKNQILKRLFDIVFSSIVLIILLPVFIVLAIVIRIESPGPAIFRQIRIGADNKEFRIYKFRTMSVQSRRQSDTQWTVVNDARVTRLGRFLRKTGLDELPQFWNVLMGSMSVVGPRPERRHFVEQFKMEVPRYKVRHQVRSGITGWAQVNGLRGDSCIKKRIEHDLYYIEAWSLWLDICIILKTVFGRKTRENAY